MGGRTLAWRQKKQTLGEQMFLGPAETVSSIEKYFKR